MKNTLIFPILITLLVISFFGRLGAQHITNPQLQPQNCDEYIQNSDLDKFVGVWIGNSNNKSIEIVLKKTKVHLPTLIPSFTQDKCYDVVYGFHKFIKDNLEKENTLLFSTSTIYEKKNSVIAGTDNNNANVLVGTITHETKNKSIRFKISYLDSTHIKIESLENLPGVRINEPGKPPYDSSIDIPSGIILTKQ